MRKVHSHFDPPQLPWEQFDEVSLTEPDTTMSIEQILDSYQSGIVIEGDPESTYDFDDDEDHDEMATNYDDVLDAIDHYPVPEEQQPEEHSVEQPPEEHSEEQQPESKESVD